MRKIRKTTSLVSAVMVLVLTVLALSTATYAWFSADNVVSLSTISFEVDHDTRGDGDLRILWWYMKKEDIFTPEGLAQLEGKTSLEARATSLRLNPMGNFFEVVEPLYSSYRAVLSPAMPTVAPRKGLDPSTFLHRKDKNTILVVTKGGFDELLARCNRIVGDNGKVCEITSAEYKGLAAENNAMAQKALRVLCMAYSEIAINAEPDEEQLSEITASAEQKLIFVGMVGMIDPPREEAKVAVEQCKKAGIKPVMITGDHKITASAIAESLGIMSAGDKVLTGADVESMNDDELRDIAGSVSVFARVAPEHKVRIVKAFQNLGNVVAMTGDGVNDAPALKLANIGVAMGITGTDVSKEAADVVLADDNFATIVQSVREGRRIYDNLIKSIQFMISTNLGEIVLLLVAVLVNLDMPLLPIQLLFINLVGDSLPSLALSVDHAAKDIMSRRPIDPNQGIFTRPFTTKITVQALILGAATIVAYLVGYKTSTDAARTMTFAVMIFITGRSYPAAPL